MRIQHARNERGIALVLALVTLVVVGGLVAGAFLIGSQEQTFGRNMVKEQQAFGAADGGAEAVVANWSAGRYNEMANGSSVTVAQTWLSGRSGWYRGSVQRLSDNLFMVTSEGFSRDSSARQRVGALVRLRTLELNINAALKLQSATKIGGSSFIDGNDHTSSQWTDCPATGPALPGVRTKDSAGITYSAGGPNDYIAGTPRIKKDTSLNTATMMTFGDQTFDSLTTLAHKTLPGGTYIGVDPSLTGAACNTASQTNWGDPLHPASLCGPYWPIIWIQGNGTVTGNHGQGILLVSGDLNVQGGFEFYGPVIIRGHLKAAGTGGLVNGAVVAVGDGVEQDAMLSNLVITYSSCSLVKALTNSAAGGLLRERSWLNIN